MLALPGDPSCRLWEGTPGHLVNLGNLSRVEISIDCEPKAKASCPFHRIAREGPILDLDPPSSRTAHLEAQNLWYRALYRCHVPGNLFLLASLHLLLVHPEEPWDHSAAPAEVRVLGRDSCRNRWNWCVRLEGRHCRQLRSVYHVISGVSGLWESGRRWDWREGSVKTFSMVTSGVAVV